MVQLRKCHKPEEAQRQIEAAQWQLRRYNMQYLTYSSWMMSSFHKLIEAWKISSWIKLTVLLFLNHYFDVLPTITIQYHASYVEYASSVSCGSISGPFMLCILLSCADPNCTSMLVWMHSKIQVEGAIQLKLLQIHDTVMNTITLWRGTLNDT